MTDSIEEVFAKLKQPWGVSLRSATGTAIFWAPPQVQMVQMGQLDFEFSWS
jgi:hypothetical protein